MLRFDAAFDGLAGHRTQKTNRISSDFLPVSTKTRLVLMLLGNKDAELHLFLNPLCIFLVCHHQRPLGLGLMTFEMLKAPSNKSLNS